MGGEIGEWESGKSAAEAMTLLVAANHHTRKRDRHIEAREAVESSIT
jgi:hypothetical protein